MDKKLLIIVEGMDNTGKDTLISGIKSHFNKSDIEEIHFTGPSIKDNIIAYIEQIKQYGDKLLQTALLDKDIIIWNRSYMGEYVYGQIYREVNKYDVEKMIKVMNTELSKLDINILYVQLICTSNTLIIDNEDGKSLSNSVDNYKTYLKTLKKERTLFKETYNLIPDDFYKIMINVNKGESFRSKEDILNDIINKINEIE